MGCIVCSLFDSVPVTIFPDLLAIGLGFWTLYQVLTPLVWSLPGKSFRFFGYGLKEREKSWWRADADKKRAKRGIKIRTLCLQKKKAPATVEEVKDIKQSLAFLTEEVSVVSQQQKNILALVEEVKVLRIQNAEKEKWAISLLMVTFELIFLCMKMSKLVCVWMLVLVCVDVFVCCWSCCCLSSWKQQTFLYHRCFVLSMWERILNDIFLLSFFCLNKCCLNQCTNKDQHVFNDPDHNKGDDCFLVFS